MTSEGRPIVLAARGISKAYPGVLANEDVSFDVRQGEIHALLGENGAGKSTLAHILAGSQRADSGHLEIDGRRVQFRSPRDAFKAGVGLVAQHFELVGVLTVAENVLLADPNQSWFWSKRRAHEDVSRIGAQYGFPIDPAATVQDLSLGEQQQLEILRALYRGAKVLLLDEPTSVLTPQQSETLMASLRRMASQDKSVVFISHKLSEVMAIADRITVMRDGRVVATTRPSETSPSELANAMVGRPVDLSSKADRPSLGPTLLAVSGLSAASKDGRTKLSGINIDVKGGEIAGIAGVSGNGQGLLADAIAGIAAVDSGTIHVCGQSTANRGAAAARRAGLRYVPGDRLGTGLAPGLTIAENIALTETKSLVFGNGQSNRRAQALLERFSVKANGVRTPVKHLSGGNAQKVLLGRELGDHSEVSIVVSPTWGLDVGAVEFVRNLLHERRSNGGAVLLISEDLEEICALSDRIYVICGGRIDSEFGGPDYDVSAIGMAMVGASAAV